MINFYPDHLIFQWHITERCNKRCKHCYHEDFVSEDLSFNKLIEILEQFKDFLTKCRKESGMKIPAQINITGGEALLHHDCWKLFQKLSSERDLYRFAILTNGSLIDTERATELKELNPRFIQLSLEGKKETHDYIRGTGDYERTLGTLKLLSEKNLTTFVSVTAHKMNFREFPEVAHAAKEFNVNLVWTDRLIPYGQSIDAKLQTLNPSETEEYLKMLKGLKKEFATDRQSPTRIGVYRSLQFLAGGRTYHCRAGKELVCVNARGEYQPCSRVPESLASVFDSSISEIYFNSAELLKIRNRGIPEGCQSCLHSQSCQGGLRCLGLAVNGHEQGKDPGCPIRD